MRILFLNRNNFRKIVFLISIIFCLFEPVTLVCAKEKVPEWKRKRIALNECYIKDEFRLFYTRQGKNGLSPAQSIDSDMDGVPDKIQNIAIQLVVARDMYVNIFKLRHPFNSPRYKDRVNYFDVHVTKLPLESGGAKNGSAGDGIVNYKRPIDPTSGVEVLSIDISKDLPCTNLTPAHELFHEFQNGYTLFKNSWYTEGTARWAEYAFRKGVGKAGQIPQADSDRDHLYTLKYEACEFWNALAKEIDPVGIINIPSWLGRVRYIGNGKKVIEDQRLHGIKFIKSVLEELDGTDDKVSEMEGLNSLYWKESRQKSISNNDIIWSATLKVYKQLSSR